MKPRIDFPALNRVLLAEVRDLLRQWLPGGRFRAGEYECGNLSGGPGHSLGVNLTTGRWNDRATGDHGGDLISLYAAIHGIRQIEAARELTGRAGEAAISRSEAQGSNQYGSKEKEPVNSEENVDLQIL